ncbi:MAG: hypothetical protein KDK36_08085 [Leptospiraceae bacterium]|nr:hypothetical protein [Leptospiraceae bacterium]
MNISDIFTYIEKSPGKFPNTINVMQQVSIEILNIWKQAANFSANVPVKQGGTGWFGKQYIYQGNIEIAQKSPFRFEIFYKQYNSKHIDFQKIVEEGRDAFDIAKNLLAKSRKVRISTKNKIKYLIVPLPNSGDYEQTPTFDMTIIDTFQEPANQGGGNITRNEYDYDYKKIDETTKRNNAARFTQLTKNGSQTTSKNLVAISENSNWNPYPAIKGTKFSVKMQRVADAKINAARNRIIQALDSDLKRLRHKK